MPWEYTIGAVLSTHIAYSYRRGLDISLSGPELCVKSIFQEWEQGEG